MPIYEYRCSSCGHQQEYIQKISDPVLTTCPACARETYAKMLTAAGFQLKGSGWYATDFKNAGAKPAAGKGAKEAGAGSETKSDAKTDAKTDAKSGDPGPAKSCGAACACS
ncbi:MAG: zinc ribbon domain-containing protein [Burkholderiales bacterium]|nr:zinc ribbon domain-containing protein [Burkholderiales bacterium]